MLPTCLLGALFCFLVWDALFLLELGFPFSLSHVVVAIICIYTLFNSHIISSSTLNDLKLFGCFGVLLLFFSIASSDIQYSATRSGYILYYAFILVLVRILAIVSNTRLVLLMILASGVSVCLFALARGEQWRTRLSLSEEFNPTWLAASLTSISFCGLQLLKSTKSNIAKISLLLCVGILLFTTLRSQSRNALVAFVGGIALSLQLAVFIHPIYRGSRVSLSLQITGITITIGLILVLLVPDQIASYIDDIGKNLEINTERIQLLFIGDEDEATAGRTERWILTFAQILKGETLLGVKMAEKSQWFGSPHNMYLTFVIDFGLIGLFLFIGFLYCVGLRVHQINGSWQIWAFFYYFLLLSIGNDTFYYKYFWFGWYLFAICYQNEKDATNFITAHYHKHPK